MNDYSNYLYLIPMYYFSQYNLVKKNNNLSKTNSSKAI